MRKRADRSSIPNALMVAFAIASMMSVAGCTQEQRRTQVAEAELSGALASRDGEPTIRIVSPTNGGVVQPTFTVDVDVSNISLAPKGRTRDGEAHFHVLVDDGCLTPGVVIGDDDAVHVGSGEASVEIELSPGPHKLCVQLGDGFHVAIAVTDTIDVIVDEDAD